MACANTIYVNVLKVRASASQGRIPLDRDGRDEGGRMSVRYLNVFSAEDATEEDLRNTAVTATRELAKQSVGPAGVEPVLKKGFTGRWSSRPLRTEAKRGERRCLTMRLYDRYS